MEEYINIGKLDRNKIGKYGNKIITDEVILTYERHEHILEKHKKDFELYSYCMKEIIERPDYILEDTKNDNTIMSIKHIKNTNINIIIRLAIENNEKHSKNSIMTFYRIRDKNLKKLMKKYKTIYKDE